MSYTCKICIKEYKTYQTLWNHNKKFHNDNIIIESPKKSNESPAKIYNCKFCNKIYNKKNSRWSHEQKCSKINNKELELKIMQEKKLCLREESKILKLKIKLEKTKNIIDNYINKINYEELIFADCEKVNNTNL
jgi:hypothetical protein